MKKILEIPVLYKLFKYIVSGNYSAHFSEKFIKATGSDRILDVGCGTAEILDYLPVSCNYTGIDINKKYIENAKKRFGCRGKFINGSFEKINVMDDGKFDIVLCIGLIHHLTDIEVSSLLQSSKKVLKKNGRLITLDGCFTKEQTILKKMILFSDRGKYVRTDLEYSNLIKKEFDKYKMVLINDLIRIPYTHIIFECLA